MKKFIIILIALMFSLVGFSQSAGSKTAWVADTTTNAETEYLVLASPNVITGDRIVTLTVWGTNASGTATVTVTAQGSDDNSKWYDIAGDSTLNNAGTVTNKYFTYNNAAFLYYRVKAVSTGTGVTYLGGGITTKKK